MKTIQTKRKVLLFTFSLMFTFCASADEKYDQLVNEVEALKKQLEQVQSVLEQYKQESITKAEVQELNQKIDDSVITKERVDDLEGEVAKSGEWNSPNTLIHMAGYANVGYSSDSESYSVGSFSPIFHYQYRDKVMLESELEITIDEDGSTDIALEYLTIDYFLNDYVTVVAGKFLSPIGQFRQNIHPSWINKLASAPPGFGHDGAAPLSDVGFQLRGGFDFDETSANYAFYVSNGPRLIAAQEHDDEFELEGVEAEGFGSDNDGKKTFGGRLGFLPFKGFELGLSFATGKATVTEVELEEDVHAFKSLAFGTPDDGEGDEIDLHDEVARDYDVFGIDFAYQNSGFEVRGEYLKSKVGAADEGITASEGASWESWYTQSSYLIPNTRWEPVIRYSDFTSATESRSQQQWALGMNYLFTNSFIGKATYEFNDGAFDTNADENRWLLQLAYGF